MIGFTEQVAVKPRPAPTLDRYNKETVNWDAVAPVSVDQPVSIQPAGQTASGATEFRSQETSAWMLRTQPGHDIPALSQLAHVVWGDLELTCASVDRWPHPIIPGAVHHLEARLEKVTG